jgi:hypothetical protein
MATARLLGRNPSSLHFTTGARKQYFYTANGFRPRPKILASTLGRRKATFEAGEDETGHISKARNEGIFFFDSMINYTQDIFQY